MAIAPSLRAQLAPTVTAPTYAGVTSTTATLGGDVTSNGGAPISARGVVYSRAEANLDPLLGGANVTNATSEAGTGVFTVGANGLAPNTYYAFKAYATNSAGTRYTATGSFRTALELAIGSAGNGAVSVSNLQPTVGMTWMIAVMGIFPSRADGPGPHGPALDERYIGEIRLLPYAPSSAFDSDGPFAGWMPCDGRLLAIAQHPALFAMLGNRYGGDNSVTFALPDLRGRVPIGAGQGPGLTNRPIGYDTMNASGLETMTLTEANLPSHSHSAGTVVADSVGSGVGVGNMQPFLALNFCVQATGTPGLLGWVRIFGFDFVPDGFLPCDGRVETDAAYPGLRAKLGATFGGNGTTTFGVPDLRGRVPIGSGAATALTSTRTLAETGGVEGVVLDLDELPVHEHPWSGGITSAAGGSIPFNTMQPFLALTAVIASTGSDTDSNDAPAIGEVRFLATTVPSSAWLGCEGSAVAKTEQSGLFGQIGTTYGGDSTTFRVPQLAGIAVVGAGNGPGLSTWTLAQSRGDESVELSSSQMPRHFHTLRSAPGVATNAETNLTVSSATLGGVVDADGGAAVLDRGIVWGTTPNPTVAANKVPIGNGVGAFSQTIGSLPPTTTVHVRAYATNAIGTSYGNQVSFVTPSNPPTATDDSFSLAEDSAAIALYLLANDTSAPDVGETLTITAVTQPANGTVTFTSTNAIFAPAANFFGTTTFTYTISDGTGGVATATVTISVTPVNDPPVAVNDSLTVPEDSGGTWASVLVNDSFAPDAAETLTVTAVTQPANGITTFTGSSVSFMPTANFNGSTSFSYTIGDGNGGTASATVNVTVTAMNDVPVANNDTLTVAEDSGATVVDVLANDSIAPDLGETLAVTSITQPATGGTSTLLGGAVGFTPAANFHGATSFTYMISDGNGGYTSATVDVTITAENDPPTAVDDLFTVDEDAGATVLSVLANDTSAPDSGETLTITAVSQPANGTVTFTPANLSFTPAAGFSGSTTFTYSISDGNGGTASATVTMTVTPVDYPPTITTVSIPNVTMKIGDTVTATITVTSDADNYATGSGGVSGTIGGFALGSLSKINNTTYTARFTVTSGGTDVAAGSSIPVNVVLSDSAGNASTAYTTAISQAGDRIDANRPVISAVSIPNAAMKVGDTVTAIITVSSDTDTLTLGTSNIGGFTLGSLTKINNTTYTATFTVTNGGTDVAAVSALPLSVVLIDSAGNASTAFTTAISQGGDPIDANRPVISAVNIPNVAMRVGDTVTAIITVTSDTDTLALGMSNIGGFTLGSLSKINNTTYTATFTVTNGGTDVAAGSNIPLRVVLTDSAGNTSNAFTTAINQNADVLDANAPAAPSIAAITTDTGNSSSDRITNDTTLELAGTAEANSMVTVSRAGTGVLGMTPADGAGHWSYNYTGTTLGEGNYTFTARAMDAVGNVSAVSASFVVTIETTAPTVASVRVPVNAIYLAGQHLDFTVYWTEDVTVDTSGDTPALTLTIGSAGRSAAYVSGTGTNALVFRYTVQSGDVDDDGIAVGALVLNSGTIQDAAANNAVLTLNSVESTTAVLVDALAPIVLSIERQVPTSTSTNATSVTYRVTFSEPVSGVDVADFTLTRTGTASGTIASVSGSGAVRDVTINTITGAGTLRLDLNNSGTGIVDTPAANPVTSGYTSGQTYTIDQSAPTVSNVTTPAPNGWYKIGDVIPIAVTFSEAVFATGMVQLTVETGATDRTVSYSHGSGSATLTFNYTVQPGDFSADLDYIEGNALTVNSGSLQDAAGNDAVVALVSPGSAGSLGANKAIVVDGISATVTNVTSATADGVYKPGEAILIQVEFSEAVIVSGTPQLMLETGATDRTIDYAAGSGTTDLTFNYIVQPGDASVDLDYVSATSFALNGAQIRDRAGNPATLALPAPGAAGSLAMNKMLVVDGVAPIVSSINRQTPSSASTEATTVLFRVTFSEAVTGVDRTDFTLTRTGGADGVVASVVSVNSVAYDVTVSTNSDAGTLRLDLNDAATGITDEIGNGLAAGFTAGESYTLISPEEPAKSGQTITFADIGDRLTTDQPFTLNATASSRLIVRFAVIAGPATISGSTVTLTGVPGVVVIRATQPGNRSYDAAPAVERSFTVKAAPPPLVPPISAGGNAVLSVGTHGTGCTYQWQWNGANLGGATSAALTLPNCQPANAGLYSYTVTTPGGASSTSEPVIVGLTTTEKVEGAAEEVLTDVQHPNGNVYDQLLLDGGAATLTANPAQITRISFIDLSNDIVQVEFSGAGTLSLVVDGVTIPAPPANYQQPEVEYVRGHAGIVITGANETSNVCVFSVGRMTAVDQTLFRDNVNYDGVANIAFIAIQSTNGKFGGVRTGNVEFFASRGYTGVYAPGVAFVGPVNIGDIQAHDDATPVLICGSANDVRITGGSLLQPNGSPVKVKGVARLQFVEGRTSHNGILPSQSNRAVLEQDGIDVTDLIVAALHSQTWRGGER